MRLRLAVFILVTAVFAAPALADKPVHILSFTDYETGPVEDWLRTKGFSFEQDAKRRDRIDLDVAEDKGLVIEAKRKAFGILPNETVNLADFSIIEIDWGVTTFPKGASYEQGVRNEALMVMVFLGDERQPSGSMFIPDSPYFIALFLCDGDDQPLKPYVGKYFKKSGRYVCLEKPQTGAAVTTSFDLYAAYRQFFDKEGDDDPGVSGMAIALDTTKAKDSGETSAFLTQIRFLKP